MIADPTSEGASSISRSAQRDNLEPIIAELPACASRCFGKSRSSKNQTCAPPHPQRNARNRRRRIPSLPCLPSADLTAGGKRHFLFPASLWSQVDIFELHLKATGAQQVGNAFTTFH